MEVKIFEGKFYNYVKDRDYTTLISLIKNKISKLGVDILVGGYTFNNEIFLEIIVNDEFKEEIFNKIVKIVMDFNKIILTKDGFKIKIKPKIFFKKTVPLKI